MSAPTWVAVLIWVSSTVFAVSYLVFLLRQPDSEEERTKEPAP